MQMVALEKAEESHVPPTAHWLPEMEGRAGRNAENGRSHQRSHPLDDACRSSPSAPSKTRTPPSSSHSLFSPALPPSPKPVCVDAHASRRHQPLRLRCPLAQERDHHVLVQRQRLDPLGQRRQLLRRPIQSYDRLKDAQRM